jgi:hypothetical protein
MSEFEFYLHNKPTVYADEQIKSKVRDMKLNTGAIVHASKYHLMNDPEGYHEHLKRELTMKLADHALTENKIKFTTYDNPVLDTKDLRAETLIMTYEDLYRLLGQFGIYIKSTERRHHD